MSFHLRKRLFFKQLFTKYITIIVLVPRDYHIWNNSTGRLVYDLDHLFHQKQIVYHYSNTKSDLYEQEEDYL